MHRSQRGSGSSGAHVDGTDRYKCPFTQIAGELPSAQAEGEFWQAAP